MSVPRDPDLIVTDWLEAGPTRLPDETRRAITVGLRNTSQRRSILGRPWGSPVSPSLKVAGGAFALVLVAVVSLTLLGPLLEVGGRHPVVSVSPSPSPTVSPLQSAPASPSEVSSGLAEQGWTEYRSDRYGFTMGYPAGWNVRASERAWTFATDATDRSSAAQEAFTSPDGAIRVSAWSVPLDPGTTLQSTADFESWIEAYCEQTENAPCTEIGGRAVLLCIEARDCHPSFLVPFTSDVQAFLVGGIYDANEMVVVAIWQVGSEPSSYGASADVLEAFLSTMAVWPESTPFRDRVVRPAPRPGPF